MNMYETVLVNNKQGECDATYVRESSSSMAYVYFMALADRDLTNDRGRRKQKAIKSDTSPRPS